MAKKKSSSKKKPAAGSSVKSATNKSTPKLGRKQARLAAGKAIGKSVLRGVPGIGTAMAAGDAISAVRGSRGLGTGLSGRRRKGKVPKAVRKWANRIVSRRKQEEKIIKSLFGSDGGKVIKKAKKGSVGVITQEERLAALRR